MVAAACGGPQRPRARTADQLAGLRIEGSRAIEPGQLAPGLALHQALQGDVGVGVDPYLVAVDAERIRAAYVKRGYFAARVTTRVEREGQGQVVVFAVAAGRRAMTKVEIAGLPAEVPRARARAQVALDDGTPFDYESYQAARQPLIAMLRDAGYARAEVRGTVVADAGGVIAAVRYEVVSGPRCVFGAIVIKGELPASLAAAVRARLRVASGDRYSASALEATRAELYELGRFSTVRVVEARDTADRDAAGGGGDAAGGNAAGGNAAGGNAAGGNAAGSNAAGSNVVGGPAQVADAVDVVIELALASRLEFHVGGGVGYEPTAFEVHGRGGFSAVPTTLPLLTLGAEARAALKTPHDFAPDEILTELRALVSAQYLDLVWPRVRGEVAGGADYQTVEAYTWTGVNGQLGLVVPPARWLRMRIGWVIEHLQFSNLSPALDDEMRRTLRLDRDQIRGAYQAQVIADLRDNPVEPRRGAYAELQVARGTRYALGELTYVRVTPELRGYVAVGGVVIAARARVGAIFGDVPVTERYFSGGTAGQRGFSDRRLSPIATAVREDGTHSVVIGGAGLIETGIELRRWLGTLWSFPIGANVFLDGADVTLAPDELAADRLYWAVGAGGFARLVGDLKLRADLGYRLNDRGATDPLRIAGWRDSFKFHVAVGDAF